MWLKPKIEMEKEKIPTLILCLCAFLMVIILCTEFCLFSALQKIENSSHQQEDLITEQQIIDNCNSTDIFNASECVNNYVNDFFTYNYTDSNRKLSFSELRDHGGACRDYARFYCDVLVKYGFRCVIIKINYKDISHVYAKVWDYNKPTGYVILDQIKIFIFKFKEQK